MQLYRDRETDKEAGKRFASLYRAFMEAMIVWYKDGLWDETTREIAEAASR